MLADAAVCQIILERPVRDLSGPLKFDLSDELKQSFTCMAAPQDRVHRTGTRTRYETALWRQVYQVIFVRDYLRRQILT